MMALNDLTGPSAGPLAQIPYFIHSFKDQNPKSCTVQGVTAKEPRDGVTASKLSRTEKKYPKRGTQSEITEGTV